MFLLKSNKNYQNKEAELPNTGEIKFIRGKVPVGRSGKGLLNCLNYLALHKPLKERRIICRSHEDRKFAVIGDARTTKAVTILFGNQRDSSNLSEEQYNSWALCRNKSRQTIKKIFSSYQSDDKNELSDDISFDNPQQHYAEKKLTISCYFVSLPGVALGQTYPTALLTPPRLVNDFVGNLLSSQQSTALKENWRFIMIVLLM
jgi:hypothetical protein